MAGRPEADIGPAYAQTAHAPIYPGVSVFVCVQSDTDLVPEATIALGNVVPFSRIRRDVGRRAVDVLPSERPTLTVPAGNRDWARGSTLLVCSLLAHAGALAVFDRPPSPKASIGMEVITVELVLGTNTNAGLATTPSPSEEAQNSIAAEATAKQVEIAEQPELSPEPAVAEKSEVIPAVVPQPPATATEPTPKPSEVKATEIKRKPDAPAPKPVPSRERKKTTPSRVNSAAAATSSGIGRGRSDTNTNYRGIVAAHLARYKQFPPDARRSGNQGSGIVTFRIDGTGRVTSVRLVRAIGVDSLDREIVAWVNRASPFPPPPDGRPQNFTQPVSFQLSGR